MKVLISYPPLDSVKGVPQLGQNRQFQWFNNPSFIYPMVPASAATLLKHEGYDVIWKDAIVERWSYKKFLDFFEKQKPDLIALETKTPVIKLHWKIIDDLKQINPDCKVVLMGDHVTALPKESMQNSKTDYIITGGDYDFLLLNLCNHISKKEKLKLGIYYRRNKKIRNTGRFLLDHDLNSLPFIDRDLTKWQLYGEHIFKRKPATYTTVGRDCWYGKCKFCSWPTLFPKFRTKTPKRLLDEIGVLIDRYNIKEIFDDTGTFPVGNWLKEFCKGMIERGYNKKITISCNMRVDACSLNDFFMMKKAGFRLFKFGLESANQKTLDRLDKGITVEQIKQACKNATKAGLEVHLTSMVGYPWETKKDAKNTINLAKWLMSKGYADLLQATVTIPYPGSKLYNEAVKNSWLRTKPGEWERFDMTEPVMKTVDMQPNEVIAMCNGIYKSFFSSGYIFHRLTSIRSLDDIKFIAEGSKAVLGHLLDFTSNRSKNEKSNNNCTCVQ